MNKLDLKQAKLMASHLERSGWMLFDETPYDLMSTQKDDYTVWVELFKFCGDLHVPDLVSAVKEFKEAHEYAKNFEISL